MGDRYTILGAIAKGGMAQVYLGRMVASAGFSRLVAIKRLHEPLSTDRNFVGMLLDEARLTAQIRHTNVVDTLDLVVRDGAFALVLEWVEGESLHALVRRSSEANERVPRPVALAIMQGVLRGLVAAHEARGEDGQPLGIVHRDVSPHNVLVGVDGIPRIIDFGVAKAFGKLESTRPGEIRGKYGYMAPEQLMGRPVTRQVDVYAAGVMMWELLTGDRLFKGDDERVVCAAVLRGAIAKPSTVDADVPPELDAIVMQATARETASRYFDAREMLAALEPLGRASEDEVGAWVRSLAAETLEAHQRLIQAAAAPTAARSIDEILEELKAPPSAREPKVAPTGTLPSPGSTDLDRFESAPRERAASMPSFAGPPAAMRPARPRATTALAIFGTLAAMGLVLALMALVGSRSTRAAHAEDGLAASTPATTSSAPSAPVGSVVEPRPLETTAAAPPSAEDSPKPAALTRPAARGRPSRPSHPPRLPEPKGDPAATRN